MEKTMTVMDKQMKIMFAYLEGLVEEEIVVELVEE